MREDVAVNLASQVVDPGVPFGVQHQVVIEIPVDVPGYPLAADKYVVVRHIGEILGTPGCSQVKGFLVCPVRVLTSRSRNTARGGSRRISVGADGRKNPMHVVACRRGVGALYVDRRAGADDPIT